MACISEVRPLDLDGGGPGRRAALVGPRGAEEEFIGLRHGSREVRREGGRGGVARSGEAESLTFEFEVSKASSLRLFGLPNGGVSGKDRFIFKPQGS